LSEARDLSRKNSEICLNWANLVLEQIESEINPITKLELRAKQCLMYGYGILNHKFGEFTPNDTFELISMNMLFHNGLVFNDHAKDLVKILNFL
jgi:hypothetical protein